MDKALVFGTKDCRFESCQGHSKHARARMTAVLVAGVHVSDACEHARQYLAVRTDVRNYVIVVSRYVLFLVSGSRGGSVSYCGRASVHPRPVAMNSTCVYMYTYTYLYMYVKLYVKMYMYSICTCMGMVRVGATEKLTAP
jgi:hypothetical protein